MTESRRTRDRRAFFGLPDARTLLLGFIAAWHHNGDGRQAAILNRMVMLICAAHLPYIKERGGTERKEGWE